MQTGESALHFAIMAGKIEIVKILIEDYGIDPTIRNKVSQCMNLWVDVAPRCSGTLKQKSKLRMTYVPLLFLCSERDYP